MRDLTPQTSFILMHYTHMQLSSWNGVIKSNSQIYCCHGRVALSKAYNYYHLSPTPTLWTRCSRSRSRRQAIPEPLNPKPLPNPPVLHTAHYTLHTRHTTHDTLHTTHTTHYTLHNTHNTRYTLQTTHYTLRTHFTLHTTHFTLHISHFKLNT